MELCNFVISGLQETRKAFSRELTWLWFCVGVIGFIIRNDFAGVTSFVRVFRLSENAYYCFLRMFHSSGIDLKKLVECWSGYVFKILDAFILRENERVVLATDGSKVSKSGKKMPAVKTLHQESESNTKPEYITGHSFQEVGVLCKTLEKVLFIPIVAAIHEGLKLADTDSDTIFDRFRDFYKIPCLSNCYLLADAYYANRTMIENCLANNSHLVTRIKSNTVAYEPFEGRHDGRGRKPVYGRKRKLREEFKCEEGWTETELELYGKKEGIKYKELNLLWKKSRRMVKFVLVIMSDGGCLIFMTTDLKLDPERVIVLYSYRFKIEVSFKVSKQLIGAFAYHFWMKSMKRLGRRPKTQELQNESPKYIEKVERKMKTFHVFVTAALIAQGLITSVCILWPSLSWKGYGLWMRTMNTSSIPPESVGKYVLLKSFGELNEGTGLWAKITKLITKYSRERQQDIAA